MPINTYGIRKEKLFRRLRGELMANGLQNPDVGRLINRSADYVSLCLNGKAQWDLAEQYLIMDAINRPYSDLHIIFPKDGHDDLVKFPAELEK